MGSHLDALTSPGHTLPSWLLAKAVCWLTPAEADEMLHWGKPQGEGPGGSCGEWLGPLRGAEAGVGLPRGIQQQLAGGSILGDELQCGRATPAQDVMAGV